jgi:hypothetical protein
MSYLNPLHPPVPSSIHSLYTTLAKACSTHQSPFSQSMLPSHRRLPQTLSSKMTASRRSSPCPAITFDLYGAPSRGLGVPMCEILSRSGGALERMLVGAQMSGSLGFRRVNLKILVMQLISWMNSSSLTSVLALVAGIQASWSDSLPWLIHSSWSAHPLPTRCPSCAYICALHRCLCFPSPSGVSAQCLTGAVMLPPCAACIR